MEHRLEALTQLATTLQRRWRVDALLTRVVEATMTVMDADHASVRLFDPASENLVAVCRSGQPISGEPEPFARGEGLLGWVAARSEAICVSDASHDARFVERPDGERFVSFAGAPLVAGLTTFGVVSAVTHERRMAKQELVYLRLVAAMCAPQLEIARLSRLSEVDALTGTLNRRGFDQLFPSEEAPDAARPHAGLSLILVDIDHFKKVNDEHGHAFGDEVLKRVAKLLAQCVRSADEVVRLGGEEFLMVLPGVDLDEALVVAERARREVENSAIELGVHAIHVTISAGVAERRVGERRDEVVARADEAMYAAKDQGRNRVVAAPV